MVAAGWMVQIYAMGDAEAQRVVGGVLSGIDGLAVEAVVREADRFLIVSCSTATQAVSVQRFVTAIDPGAVLVHTSTGSRRLVDASVA